MVIADIESDLLEYADFEEVASVARAKSFITAANRWLILRPESASNQSSSLSINKSTVQDLMRRAQDFVAANDSSGGAVNGVRFLGAGGNFR
jgi:hypothetical protein